MGAIGLNDGQTLDRLRRGTGISRAPPPARVEAETGDAEFLEESEVFREVCVIHVRAKSGSKRTTLALLQLKRPRSRP